VIRGRKKRGYLLDPAVVCRVSKELIADIADETELRPLFVSYLIWLLVGSMLYGFVFGIWRSPEQALLSVAKMPIFMLTLTAFSVVINMLLAQAVGGITMTFRKVSVCIMLSLAITAIVMGALSPIMLFFTFQFPARTSPEAMQTYGILLALHTLMIAVSGVIGNVCMYRLLVGLTGLRKTAVRVLVCWILVTGLVGAELSWVMSPFLAKPDIPVPVYNPNAFNSNFFEYILNVMTGGM
jgi:hypothetical protein